MRINKVWILLILILMLLSGYIVIPFNDGNFWGELGKTPMKWGDKTQPLSLVMWFFGIRFLLLLDSALMIMLIFMKQTKLSMLIMVSFIIITRVVDIVQLFIDGDIGGSIPIEMTINAIFLILALSAVNIINIKGLNKDVANANTSVITLSLPFSSYLSNIFKPKRKLQSDNLVKDLVEKDEKLLYIAESKENLEDPLMAKITTLVKMIDKAETSMEKEVLMHEFELTLARYAENSADIQELLDGRKNIS